MKKYYMSEDEARKKAENLLKSYVHDLCKKNKIEYMVLETDEVDDGMNKLIHAYYTYPLDSDYVKKCESNLKDAVDQYFFYILSLIRGN